MLSNCHEKILGSLRTFERYQYEATNLHMMSLFSFRKRMSNIFELNKRQIQIDSINDRTALLKCRVGDDRWHETQRSDETRFV